MSADVDLDTVGSCILFYCRDKLLVIHVLFTVFGLNEPCVEADQPPCRRSRKSCSWESYGGFPRRNSKGPEPQSSHEFAT